MINGSGKGGKTGLVERIKKGEGGKGRERREKGRNLSGLFPIRGRLFPPPARLRKQS